MCSLYTKKEILVYINRLTQKRHLDKVIYEQLQQYYRRKKELYAR